MEKQFAKQVLQDITAKATDDFAILKDDIIDHTRWAVVHEMIFEELATGKFYCSYYNRGATEMQDERPYEYDNAMVGCTEVVEEEVTIKKWIPKKENN